MNLTNIQLGTATAPGSPFTANRFIDANSFKLVINGSGTSIFEMTNGANRRFAFGGNGQYTMDAYGVGAFTGTAAKWLAVTAAGVVIEEAPPTGATITADNGLTMSTATNVQWGGTLIQNTTITQSNFLTTFNGTGNVVEINKTGAANANALSVSGSGSSAAAVITQSSGSASALFASHQTSGFGISVWSATGTPLYGRRTTGTNAAINRSLLIETIVSGAASNGLGTSLEFANEASDANSYSSASIASTWTDVTLATKTSDLQFATCNLGSAPTLRMTIAGTGALRLHQYGINTFAGTPAYALGVDASGNVVEFTAAAGGGTVTSFSFTDANGFDGTVTNPTTTPNLTLTTTLTQGSVFFAGAAGAINEDNSNFFFDDASNRLGIGINTGFTATRLQIVDNTVAGASIVKITSTSTSAASNLQRGLHVELSGAHSNAGQTSSAIYGANTHSGSVPTNEGVRGEASGGTLNRGVYGLAGSGTNSYGVHGESSVTNGIGVLGQCGGSSVAFGVKGTSNGGGTAMAAETGSATNSLVTGFSILASCNAGAGGTGLGSAIAWTIETTTTNQSAGSLYMDWTDGTNATRTSRMVMTGVTDADSHNFLLFSGAQSIIYSRDAGTNQTDERFSIIGTYKTLTESSATAFVRINIPSGTVTGGEIIVTVEANDATDYQSRTLRFIWSAVNKGGTITATVQTPEEAVAVSAGTLTVTIDTNDAGSGNLDFRANAVSSLTQTILRCSFQVLKNIGTGTVTPQ